MLCHIGEQIEGHKARRTHLRRVASFRHVLTLARIAQVPLLLAAHRQTHAGTHAALNLLHADGISDPECPFNGKGT